MRDCAGGIEGAYLMSRRNTCATLEKASHQLLHRPRSTASEPAIRWRLDVGIVIMIKLQMREESLEVNVADERARRAVRRSSDGCVKGSIKLIRSRAANRYLARGRTREACALQMKNTPSQHPGIINNRISKHVAW